MLAHQNGRKTRPTTKIGVPVFILIVAIDIGVCLAQSTHAQDLRHGQTIYRIYCAVCHGDDGHGDGPMSTILKVQVPDLTQIKMRNGGVFPVERVQRKIDGSESEGLGHGTREMPIFGPVFTQTGPNGKNGRVRVHDLTKYLQSIQVEASEKNISKPL
jgi:mono/diheme cytochrome c family protein